MLKNIEIIDYKCFKDFKLDGLSQINIISGGNNVGKTALLETLFIEKHLWCDKVFGCSNPLIPLYSIAINRDISFNKFQNYLRNINLSLKSNNIDAKVNYKYVYNLLDKEKEKAKEFNQDYSEYIVSYLNDNLNLYPTVNYEPNYIPNNYINSSKPTNKNLVNLYSNIQTKGIQHKFLDYLKILDNNIAWVEPQLIDNELLLRINLNNPETSLISSELGEGVNRYTEILSILLSQYKDGSVFIDEIENGIHYTKLKDIWKAIIQIVQKEEIQLFATTHDKETIEALKEASEEMNYNEITSIKLSRDSNNQIVPTIRKYDNFSYGVERGRI